VTLIGNDFGGYVSFDTIDIFSAGNTYRGTGGSTVTGKILSANQKTGSFNDTFIDSNTLPELPGAKFKRNSAVSVLLERSAVANSSEWLGFQHKTEAGALWGRDSGLRVTNSTAGFESSVVVVGSMFQGTYKQRGFGLGQAAPTSGVYILGDTIRNSAPAVGQPKEWINTQDGGAYSTTRANTTGYTVGIYALWTTGTTVWECTTAGTSAGAAPSIVGKVVGDTVVDGSVTWTMRATTQANFVSAGNL
jgi:hypothetical protein